MAKKKSAWPKTIRGVKIPLYPGTIYYIYNKDDYVKAIEYLDPRNEGDLPDRDNLPLGLSVAMGHPETNEVIYLLCTFDGDVQTLVHECGHIALNVCRHVGINPLSADEAYCYLLDWIFGEATPSEEDKKSTVNEPVPGGQEVLHEGGEIGSSSGDRRGIRSGPR